MRSLNRLLFVISLLAGALQALPARAQHLWWDLGGQKDATCVYGEITVLATNPGIYYCGANWHPGEPAGGYCGIQHNTATERRTIFSIWDTTPELHPGTTFADPKTITNRFGGEGTGGHTHMLWPWELGQTFQFFVQKSPRAGKDLIDAQYFVRDPKDKKWLHSATITCPIGGKESVATIGGGVNSFLENFTGQDKEVPKIAIYRLWIGADVDHLKCLTRATGDGKWGELHDAYFLAQGNDEKLKQTLAKLEKQYGKAVFAEKDAKLPPLTDTAIPAETVSDLKQVLR